MKQPLRIIQYSPGLKIMKPSQTSPSPLLPFFPYLCSARSEKTGPELQELVQLKEIDLTRINDLGYHLAAQYMQISQLKGIQFWPDFIQEQYSVAQIEKQALFKFSNELSQQCIRFLSKTDTSDPLYPHVKSFLQSICDKAVLSLAAFMKVSSTEQPVSLIRPELEVINNLDYIVLNIMQPPQDFQEQVKQIMEKMNGLLSAYAIYYVALVFCMPDLIVSCNAPKSKYQLG